MLDHAFAACRTHDSLSCSIPAAHKFRLTGIMNSARQLPVLGCTNIHAGFSETVLSDCT